MVSSTQVEDNAGKRAANNDDISSSDNENNHTSKKVKREGDSEDDNDGQTSSITDSNIDNDKPGKGKGGAKNKEPMSKAREIRLEQNRKAARESRRRKKVLQEELQRSVIFFSRANGTLKQQNEELQRMLAQARTQVSAIESGQGGGGMLQQQQQPAGGDAKDTNQNQVQAGQTPQLNNNAVAAQAQGGGQMGMGQFNAQAGQGQQQQVQGNGNNQVFDPNNTGAQSAPAPAADSNNMMNWMNFQAAAMAGGVPGLASMGFDPNSPYAQALGQFAMQQQQAQAPAANSNGSSTPNPALQFPFMQNPGAGMLPMQFAAGANPFQFSQFGAAPNASAAWGAAGNNMGNSQSPGGQAPANA